MKPATFDDLPGKLQESLLWEIDLDYCSYESSKAEAIHDIMNGQISLTNKGRIESAYKWMDEDKLVGYARNLRDQAAQEVESLNKLISELL